MTDREILIKIRKDNNLTQEELAKNINVSRETISKWERGTNSIPKDIYLEIIKKYNYKIKKKWPIKLSIEYSVITILIIIFIYLLYYFLFNYKRTRIYELSGYKNGITINNGLLVVTNNKVYIQLNQLEMDNNNQLENIELYYYDDNKKSFILKMNKCDNKLDIQIVNEYGKDEQFSRKQTQAIQKKLYLKLFFSNRDTTIIDIKPVLTYINSFNYSFSHKKATSINNSKHVISNEIKNNFIYNKIDNSYILEKGSVKIEYLVLTDTLIVHEDKSIYTYYFNDKTLYYSDEENNFTYSYVKKECVEKICLKNVLNKFNDDYK